MARTYLSVNISQDQQEFIRLLDEYEIDIFSIETISQQIGKAFSNLNEILENLVDKKFLSRIEKGKYCRTTFRDELVIWSSFILFVVVLIPINTFGQSNEQSNFDKYIQINTEYSQINEKNYIERDFDVLPKYTYNLIAGIRYRL